MLKILKSLFLVLSLSLYSSEVVPSKNVKIVIFAPETAVDALLETMAKCGAGKIGNYEGCSFTSKGDARWRATEGALPSLGEVGTYTSSKEVRIESICPIDLLEKMISELKKIHPYEEMGYDLYPLLELKTSLD